jgi:outer membrane protein
LNGLGGKIMQVLTKYSNEKQSTMVFDVSGQPNNILFASTAIDITHDIIAMYDAQTPSTPATSAIKPPAASTGSAPKRPAAAPATAPK